MNKELEINIDALVNRFLAWPLPDSVCSDVCATVPNTPKRTGTNLLTATEAKEMLLQVVGEELATLHTRLIGVEKERDDLKRWIKRKVVVDSDGDPI